MPELTDFQKLDPQTEETTPENYLGFTDVPESARDSLKVILDKFTADEKAYRYRQLKGFKLHNLFWAGNTNVIWTGPNDIQGDWVSVADALRAIGSNDLQVDPALYDDNICVYRAYGEVIVGALTTSVPSVRFFPSNADEINDIRTSAAYKRISKKIQQDNKIEVFMPELVKVMCNEGLVAVYNYSQYDEKYGTVTRDVYGRGIVNVNKTYCPNCTALVDSSTEENEAHDLTSGANLSNEEILQTPLKDEFDENGLLAEGDPFDPSSVEPSQQVPQDFAQNPFSNPIQCPECGFAGPGDSESYQEEAAVKKETKDFPKCRQILEVYGGLQVQIPQFARKPQDVGTLILYSESNYAQAKSLFPWIKDKIVPSDDDNYYRWSRQFVGLYQDDSSLVTFRRIWFRPWMYEVLNDQEKIDELNALFPDGVYCVFINEIFAQAFNEDFDEHWTLSSHPLSERIYSDPLLKFTIPVQRMTDDVVALTLETIKSGIPTVFADPEFFDFEKWGKTRATPGAIYPMKRVPGQNMESMFGTIKPATLSKEIDPFMSRLDFFGQLMSGAFNSIFGGASAGTLGQDELNKQQALQRLGIAWTVVKSLFATVMSKATKAYAEGLLEDEVVTEKIGNSYINSVIRLEDLTGKIGEVAPEASENFPMTWGQKRVMLLELMKLNNPEILAWLGNPENIGKVADTIGWDELYVPGAEQRNKQLDEISQLIQSQPLGISPETGMPISSVPIEPQVDNDEIHLSTCQAYLAGEMGLDLKRFNPIGYQNVLAHAQEHQMSIQMKQQQMMMAQAQQQEDQSQSEQFQE